MSRIKKWKMGDTVYDVGPGKTSELQNDSGFITSDALPTKVSDLTNDSGFITSDALPTKVSDLTNDSGFITEDDVAVDDVKINGTSVVTNKVANIPIANTNDLGVIKVNTAYGLMVDPTSGVLYGWPVTYDAYGNSYNGLVISKGTLENVLTGKGFLTENEAVTKTATGIQTIQSALFLGGLTSEVSFGNAITHQRKLATPDPLGRTLYGASFQVGNLSCACELITKTWDDAGANAYNTAVLRMSPNGLSFGINGSPGSSHKVPTEAEFKKVAIADDLSIVKSDKDLILKHGSTELSRASSAIPTKTSELTNDSGFITSTALPTKVSDLNNDSGFLTTANIATSQTPGVIKSGHQLSVASDGTPSCGTLTKTSYASANNSVFISKGTLANILTDYAPSSSVPTKTSDLTNDSGFLTEYDISGVYLSTSDEADQSYIKSANSHNKYISPWYQAQSVFYGLAEASGYPSYSSMTYGTYPANAKNLIKDLLGCSKTSDFTNDAGFITSDALPTKLSQFTNDSGFASLPWYYASEGSSVNASTAINSMLQTYKKVLLGPGDYYLSDSILIRKGCSIEGSGPQTVLHWTGVQSKTSTYSLIRILLNTTTATPDRISIKNLCIRGINESAVATNIDLTSTTEPDVNKGIYVQLNDVGKGTLTLDHPVILEGIIFENLSQGFSDYLYEGSENNSYISDEKEQISDRLVIRNCTFRNCYYGYHDNTDTSESGGGVKIDNCLFNRTRIAIYVKHTGYDITNCSFYHSYYRTIETTSGWTYEPDNVPIRIMGCKFFMPADVDVAHIYAAFEGANDVLLMVSDSFFIFGYLTSQYVKHIYSNMRIIMDGCRFMMRAEGSVLDNRLIFSFTINSKYMSAILNSWTNVQVIPISGLPAILNSYTDNMGTFLAG